MIGQGESAEDRRAGMRRRHRTAADALRDQWRLSGRRDWTAGEPWWTAAVDALTRAVADGRDPAGAVTRLGRERALAGTGLAQSIDDLNSFYVETNGSMAPAAIVRALVAGWRSAEVVERHEPSGDVMVV